MEFDDIDDEEDSSLTLLSLRYRPGNRFVPGFVDLVDRGCTLFSFNMIDGATCWNREVIGQQRKEEESVIVLNVAYRADGDDATASTIWDSSVVLARYLLGQRGLLEGIGRIIELGAGCGLAGLCASRLVPSETEVFLTDLPSSLPRLRNNVERNNPGVRVDALVWGQDLPASLNSSLLPIMVLAADCLLPYCDALMSALAETLAKLLGSAPRPSFALVAYEERCDVGPFFRSCELLQLRWEVSQSFDRDTLKVLRLYRC